MNIKLNTILAFFILMNSALLGGAAEDVFIDIIEPCDCNISIYERPYSMFENCPQKGLLRNTGIFVGGAVGVMGLLYLLPEDVTSWDKKNFTFKNIFGKWWDNVTAGPVWDNDKWYWNYLAHPYWGGMYYMSARSLGYNAVYSFLYTAAMSTFLWEYGIEALAEIPSKQDLIITPVAGAVVGELFYLAKREIIKNDYRVLNSKILGHTTAFLIDPVNELASILFKEKVDSKSLSVNHYLQPNIANTGKLGYNISLVYRF